MADFVANDAPELLPALALLGDFGKGRAAGEHFVQHRAQRIDVAPCVHTAHVFDLLRRHVMRRAEHEIRLGGEGHGLDASRCERLGDAEVDDLGHRTAIHLSDEDVGGLEVAMNDAFLMGVLHGTAHFSKEADALV